MKKALESGGTLNDPYTQHATVYASIRILGTNVSSVPFKVYKEAPAQRDGRTPRSRAIVQRNSYRKYMAEKILRGGLNRSSHSRAVTASVEVETGQLPELFSNPAPSLMLSRYQLWEGIVSHLSLSGECDVYMKGRTTPNAIPIELWPMSPARFKLNQHQDTGVPVNWTYYKPGTRGSGGIPLPLESVHPPNELTVFSAKPNVVAWKLHYRV